ncbi:hypothetical protein [Pseudomonas aeruginosa]|uniref:hypothetical protein n=1 Tax=Pseudomonadota TaxID=1224 RepID=UPI003D2C680B
MTMWNTKEFTAFGELTYTESRELKPGPGQLIATGFRIDLLDCVQCQETYSNFRSSMARGDAHLTCPAGHSGVINMFTDQVKDAE